MVHVIVLQWIVKTPKELSITRSETVRVFKVLRLDTIQKSSSSSNWILMSCQPHRVTSGQGTEEEEEEEKKKKKNNNNNKNKKKNKNKNKNKTNKKTEEEEEKSYPLSWSAPCHCLRLLSVALRPQKP